MKLSLSIGYKPFSFILSCIDKANKKPVQSCNLLSYKSRDIANCHFPHHTGDIFWMVSITTTPSKFFSKEGVRTVPISISKSFQRIFSLGWETPETVTLNRTWEAFRRMTATENCSFRLPRLQTVSDSKDLKISPTPFLCERSQLIFGCLFMDQPADLCRALRPSPCTVT